MDSQSDRNKSTPQSISRRRMLVAAAAGTGLALLPGVAALAANATAATQLAPRIGMGYCRTPDAGAVAASRLSEAYRVTPRRGSYELRIVGANTREPLAIAAQYAADTEHCFWQAWNECGLLQRSPLSRIRWSANAANPLLLNIRLAASSGVAQVAAQAGIYALTVVPAKQAPPTWQSLALRAETADGVAMRLVSRASGQQVDFPYALFAVRAVDEPQRI